MSLSSWSEGASLLANGLQACVLTVLGDFVALFCMAKACFWLEVPIETHLAVGLLCSDIKSSLSTTAPYQTTADCLSYYYLYW